VPLPKHGAARGAAPAVLREGAGGRVSVAEREQQERGGEARESGRSKGYRVKVLPVGIVLSSESA
jgi:hypothetical protein